ncbi:MAG: AmmeMemoRadiSam system protein B [Planctomycetota bacterium]|jgi:AmmeMemoRadiSam system protein B
MPVPLALEIKTGTGASQAMLPATEMWIGMICENAAENGNACGAGAAAVAAAKRLGKTKGVLLAHTNSNEVMQRDMGVSSPESVGYAAIVF